MNDEKRRIENEIKKMEEDLNILRQEADTIEEVRRLWIENPLLKGEWSPKVMLSVYTIWSEKLNKVLSKVKEGEEKLKRLKNLIEAINTRIEGSFVE
jgi:phage shock protein A